MRAVVFDTFSGPLAVREVSDPLCPPDGVVVAVRATGVCRSDWHAWRGHDPVGLPHTPGHELAGVVDAVGSVVNHWSVGDRVTAPFVCGCGRCEFCMAGQAQICPNQSQPGFTHSGSFADKVVIHQADFNLVRLPAEIDFVAAASLGCRFATAFRALTAHRPISPGNWVAVHGCGGVGLSAVMIAAALGARVIAVDILAAALDRARQLGAEVGLNSAAMPDPETVGAAVHELSSGGAQLSMDAIGSERAAVASVLSLRRGGHHLQVGLLLGDSARPRLPMDRIIGWELSVHGCHGMAAADYPPLLSLIAAGTLDPRRLVGTIVGLDQAGSALQALDQPTTGGITVVEVS